MKFTRSIFVATVTALFLSALSARADGTNLTAAQAWVALTNFAMPTPPMAWATNPPNQADLAKFDDLQATQAGVEAERARDFYTRFPADENAARARVTEVQALKLAIRFGATNRLAELDAREQSMLANTNAPEQLRYELRLDLLGRELQAKEASGANMKMELEKAARELVRDFPSGLEGYDILLDLAADADLLKVHEFGVLMANSGGPPELTELGKGLLRRLDAVGEPLPFEFKTADGRTVNLAAVSNKVVLVDFWATWCPGCVTLSPKIQKLYEQFHTNGFDVVGINFDDDTNQAQRFIQKEGVDWPQYFGGRGAGNKYGRQYSINVLPVVWLVDRKGIVRDIHGTTDLEAKIDKLMAE
jgi:thiol-disulfide isomerase/thioredoxin